MSDKPLTDEECWGDPDVASRSEGQTPAEAGKCPLRGIACGAWYHGCQMDACVMDGAEDRIQNSE